MIIKKYSFPFFILFFFNSVALLFAMDPIVQKPKLRPVDEVFIKACENDRDIEFAIKMGANQKCINPKNGYTGLHYACKNGNLKRILHFLGNVFDVTITVGKGIVINDLIDFDLISMIRQAGHQQVAQQVLDIFLIYASKATMPSKSFNSAIIGLLAKGANINVPDNDFVPHSDLVGFTPLHYACLRDDFDRVKCLVSCGADIHALSKTGAIPREITADNDIRDFLIKAAASDDLLKLCRDGFELEFKEFERAAKVFLRQGANINAKATLFNELDYDLRGFTPLLYACADGEIERVKFLINNGANINQKSAIGIFPLYVLFSAHVGGNDESPRFELMKYLIDNGADATLVGPGGNSLFAVMVASNSIHSIAYALDKKIAINIIDEMGCNALYEAVFHNLINLIPFLFDIGVKPPLHIQDGSLIHVATIKNNVAIVKELIDRGLNVNTRDKDQRTPLHYASESADLEMIKILLEAGADLNTIDKYGKTPLQLSKKNPSKYVAIFMQKAHKNITSISCAAKKRQELGVLLQETLQQEDVSAKKNSKKKLEKKKPKKKKKKKEKKIEKGSQVIQLQQEDILLSSYIVEKNDSDGIEAYAYIDLSPGEMLQKEIEEKQTIDIAPLQHVNSKSEKKSLLGYVQDKVQKKVVTALITPSTTKTFAQVAAYKKNQEVHKPEIKEFEDEHLRISIPVMQKPQQLLLTGNSENPLTKIKECTQHVDEKRNDPLDLFHNFSFAVEEQLGQACMRQEILEKATRKNSAKIKYTIPAMVSILGKKKVTAGEFEFIIKDETMVHRAYIPNKKSKKDSNKKPFALLPSIPTGDSGQEVQK